MGNISRWIRGDDRGPSASRSGTPDRLAVEPGTPLTGLGTSYTLNVAQYATGGWTLSLERWHGAHLVLERTRFINASDSVEALGIFLAIVDEAGWTDAE